MNPWDIVIGAGIVLALGLALYVLIRKRGIGCSCCKGDCKVCLRCEDKPEKTGMLQTGDGEDEPGWQ